jgi:hypothetical protein
LSWLALLFLAINHLEKIMKIKAIEITIFSVLVLASLGAQGATEQPTQSTEAQSGNLVTTTSENNSLSSTGAQFELNICRKKSIVRFAEAPDLYIDDMKVAEISNGTKVVHRLNQKNTFALKTKANPLLYRFKGETLIKGSAVETLFLVVRAERNLTQGITVFFGGAIAEATRQGIQVGESKNWTISIVTPNEFAERCNE